MCTLAHLRTHGSKNLDQWAAQQGSAFLYTLLSNAAYTHTHTHVKTHQHTHIQVYSCVPCRTGCSRNLTQKKKQLCQPGALLSSLSSPRSLILCLVLFSTVHCISWGALSWLQLQFALSLSSFLPHPKGFLFSFPLLLSLSFHFSSAFFGFCFCLCLLQGVSLFCFVLAFLATFPLQLMQHKDVWVNGNINDGRG